MVETTGELSTHLTSGAVIVYVIESLKASPRFSWISDDTKKLVRMFSALGAVAISTGITWQYSVSTGDLVIHGATVAAVFAFVWDCTKQFVIQQVFYDLLKGRKANGE